MRHFGPRSQIRNQHGLDGMIMQIFRGSCCTILIILVTLPPKVLSEGILPTAMDQNSPLLSKKPFIELNTWTVVVFPMIFCSLTVLKRACYYLQKHSLKITISQLNLHKKFWIINENNTFNSQNDFTHKNLAIMKNIYYSQLMKCSFRMLLTRTLSFFTHDIKHCCHLLQFRFNETLMAFPHQ